MIIFCHSENKRCTHSYDLQAFSPPDEKKWSFAMPEVYNMYAQDASLGPARLGGGYAYPVFENICQVALKLSVSEYRPPNHSMAVFWYKWAPTT
jgi:hypothetical protein